jgi:hypothetical protein
VVGELAAQGEPDAAGRAGDDREATLAVAVPAVLATRTA